MAKCEGLLFKIVWPVLLTTLFGFGRLVHCRVGVSRSATVTVSVLSKTKTWLYTDGLIR